MGVKGIPARLMLAVSSKPALPADGAKVEELDKTSSAPGAAVATTRLGARNSPPGLRLAKGGDDLKISSLPMNDATTRAWSRYGGPAPGVPAPVNASPWGRTHDAKLRVEGLCIGPLAAS